MRPAIAGYACAAGRNYVIWVPRGRRRGSANRCPIIGEEARSLTMPLAGPKRTREAWRHALTRQSVVSLMCSMTLSSLRRSSGPGSLDVRGGAAPGLVGTAWPATALAELAREAYRRPARRQRSIDDDRVHTSPAVRASARVSAARTPGSIGSPA
jgi:hypothetical protein